MDLCGLDDECIICFDHIQDNDLIGKVPCCPTKLYHKKCIEIWSSKSNSCPTCRNNFYQVEISSKCDPLNIIHVIDVKDRLLPNSAINQIPARYIINDATLSSSLMEDPVQSTTNFCCICTLTRRSDFTQRISCYYCGSNFHLTCLGIRNNIVEDSFYWFCPMCDSSQETLIPRSGAGLRRTVAVSDSMHPMRKSNSSNGLVIFNENGEIDDTFLYEDDYFEMQVPKLNTDGIPVSARVMNGGVLSRREQKQREKLTREEVSSWEVFDQALKEKETLACSQASSIAAAAAAVNSQSLDEAQDKTTKRKRRKRLVDRTSSPPLQLETTTATQSSRITSLISELKTAKKQHTSQTSLLQAPPPSQTPHIPKYTAQSSITSESTSTSLANSPMESVSYSSSDDNEYVIPKRELSFDEKSIIQKYLRSKLKCRYKPGDCSSNYISNEEQFIKINKKISRKIYSHIVNSTCEIEEYFKNECKLRDVIDGYIET